jgi:hypothetical protein
MLRHDVETMPRKPPPPDYRDAELRELRTSLYLARRTIIDLMPEPLRELLHAAIWCATFEDIRAWEAWAIERILDLAERRPGHEMGGHFGTVRAYCPLCRGEAQSPTTRGFSMPVGLERHLAGSHGSRRCEVFAAAIDPCFEELREEGRTGVRGPRLQWTRQGTPPWKIVPPEPVHAPRPLAPVIKLRGD